MTTINLDGPHVTRHDATAAPVVTRSWMTPRRLDVERITYRRMSVARTGWRTRERCQRGYGYQTATPSPGRWGAMRAMERAFATHDA